MLYKKKYLKKNITALTVLFGIILSFLPTYSAKAIIGGETTQQYPWLVAFVADGTNEVEKRIICSGSLIKPQWVITAAHCTLPSAITTVVIGRSDLSSGGQGQKRNIIQQIYNTNWNPNDPDSLWDIKLVKLDTPSTLADMDLAGSSDVSYWGQGSDVRTYGYGHYDNSIDEGSKYSRRAEFRINLLTDDHVQYWATWEGRTACRGDSGGPSITSTSSGPKQAGEFIAYQGDENYCNVGEGNLFVKTGYRGSTISPVYYWITNTI